MEEGAANSERGRAAPIRYSPLAIGLPQMRSQATPETTSFLSLSFTTAGACCLAASWSIWAHDAMITWIADLEMAGGGAVDADGLRAARRLDGVGGDPRAIADVPDVDLLVRQDVGLLEQVHVDGARAFIVKVALSDGSPVELALHHGQEHRDPSKRPARTHRGEEHGTQGFVHSR
jgi:hypothetical protein